MENNDQSPGWVEQAFERGYKEALLDMYCYMTGNAQLAETPDRLEMIDKMLEQAAANGDWLELSDK